MEKFNTVARTGVIVVNHITNKVLIKTQIIKQIIMCMNDI